VLFARVLFARVLLFRVIWFDRMRVRAICFRTVALHKKATLGDLGGALLGGLFGQKMLWIVRELACLAIVALAFCIEMAWLGLGRGRGLGTVHMDHGDGVSDVRHTSFLDGLVTRMLYQSHQSLFNSIFPCHRDAVRVIEKIRLHVSERTQYSIPASTGVPKKVTIWGTVSLYFWSRENMPVSTFRIFAPAGSVFKLTLNFPLQVLSVLVSVKTRHGALDLKPWALKVTG